MKAAVLVAILTAGAFAMPAQALTQDEARKCAAMARTFDGKIAQVETLKTERAEAAEAAEAAGETWENAEAMRDFGDAQAAEANETRDLYHAAREAFEAKDAALISATQMLNRDIDAYNRTCTTDG